MSETQPTQNIHELFAAGIRARLEPRMEVSRVILLITGSPEEYRAFLKETGLPEKYCFRIRNRDDVIRFSPHPRYEVVYYGNYWDCPALQDEIALSWLQILGAA